MDAQTYALCKKYADTVVSKMATGIDSFELQGSKLIIHTSDGDTIEMDVNPFGDGVSIDSMTLDADNNLIINLSDGGTYNAGEVPTSPGKTYVHIQETPSKRWEIQHNLNNLTPAVICFKDGEEIVGEIEYYSQNLLYINFEIAVDGEARIRNGG